MAVELSEMEELNQLREQQGAMESVGTDADELESLRTEQGDTAGEGQGITPSNNPVFEAARKSGFLKGFLDQAAGIGQLIEHVKAPDLTIPTLKAEGIDIESTSLDDFISKEEKIYQRVRKEKGLTGFDWSRMAGNILSPVSLATGSAGTLKAAATTTQKVLAASAAGGAVGLSQPVSEGKSYASEKALQAAIGVGAGAVAQPVISLIKGAGDFLKYVSRPFSKSGQLDDLAEMYSNLAGEAKNKIIFALNNAKTDVKGNIPTAGQAITAGTLKRDNFMDMTADDMIAGLRSGKYVSEGMPENFGSAIIKLEKELGRAGDVGDELKTLYAQQAARRKDSISGVIDSTDDALESAINNRSIATKPLYDKVAESKSTVNVDEVIAKIKDVISKNIYQDDVSVPMRSILAKIEAGGIKESNPGNLHSLSKQIKNMIQSKTPTGGSEFNVKVLTDVKKALDYQIGKAEPAYKRAQEVFKANSRPIDQIKVAREFGKALENSLKDEKAAPFVSAMDDAVKVLKKSTGFKRYNKLSDVMEPTQIDVLNRVKTELIREERAKKIASTTKGSIQDLSGVIEFSLPNMLSRPVMLANAVLRKISIDMGKEYEALAIKIQKDPKFLAKLLERSDGDPLKKKAMRLLERMSSMIPAQNIAGKATAPTADE